MKVLRYVMALAALVLVGCKQEQTTNQPNDVLFTALSPAETGIDFTNTVTPEKDFNIFNYRNFYNGGGVAIGDINNDGLPDVFLTSNQGDCKLFLNKGNFQFEDITEKAGVAGKHGWSTGVTFADINADGWMDIYVCNSGNKKGDDKANELYINNGNLTFTEKAAEYGLDDRGYGTHAAFFDYDRDGDLDLYLLNNSFTPIGRLGYANLREQRDPLGGDKLFRNDNGKFTDVSEQAGIYGSLIGFGLGITIGDVNNDNWPDIYISNDFYERDYLYVNQRNGTFAELSKDYFRHESLSSMGADIADLNNDGWQDIFVTDMLPWDDYRLKTTTTFEGYDLFNLKLSRDFYYQYNQNSLQLNNGNGTFSEVSRLAQVHATDWSWGALIFDMDNDGQKDIFVANGIHKNLTDQDFVNFLASEENLRRVQTGNFNIQEYLDLMETKPVSNYAFHNTGNMNFVNKAREWGLGEPGFSNGAAYGDLDNDGDLDLIVNNVNMPVGIYRNNTSEKLGSNFLKIKLKGTAANPNGIGAKVAVHHSGTVQWLQQMPNRGFQSSVDWTLVFGLGKAAQADSVVVIWTDDKMQTLGKTNVNQTLELNYADAKLIWQPEKPTAKGYFADATAATGLNFVHKESEFVDFKRDALLKQKYSTQGPALATGDVNGDGLEDIFFGGAAEQPSQLWLQQAGGKFVLKTVPAFEADKATEAVDAIFFDADGDKDLDLFIVTGSNEFNPEDNLLQDLLYLNDGKGNFTKDERLPKLYDSGAAVAAADFDKDGDTDLFVANRLIPSKYGLNPPHTLLINDGTGNFKNFTKRYLPDMEKIGMLTDAAWADTDGDGYEDLILFGEWSAPILYKNQKGRNFIADEAFAKVAASGFWHTVVPMDVDNDGDTDLVAGNLGLNSRMRIDAAHPAELHINDFDRNGEIEQIISCPAEDGKNYPMLLKGDLQTQVPMIKKKYLKFTDYAAKPISQIFDATQMEGAIVKTATEQRTGIFINNGAAGWEFRPLAWQAQVSPVQAILPMDFNGDGNTDLLLAGNFFDVLPEIVRYDALYGLLLAGDGKGNFTPVSPQQSGMVMTGQVRHLRAVMPKNGHPLIIAAKNNEPIQVWKVQRPAQQQVQ